MILTSLLRLYDFSSMSSQTRLDLRLHKIITGHHSLHHSATTHKNRNSCIWTSVRKTWLFWYAINMLQLSLFYFDFLNLHVKYFEKSIRQVLLKRLIMYNFAILVCSSHNSLHDNVDAPVPYKCYVYYLIHLFLFFQLWTKTCNSKTRTSSTSILLYTLRDR